MSLPVLLTLGAFLFPPSPTFADQPSLEALAAASGRPRECGAREGKKSRRKKPTVWQRARVPELVPYCDLLAKAHVLIDSDPKAALDLAEKADTAWPGHAGSRVAQGRALLALGKPKEALDALEKAKDLDKLSVEEPKAMSAHARALVQNGRVAEGAALYRTMVPRASLLPERHRTRLLLEASLASMMDAGQPAARDEPKPDGQPPPLAQPLTLAQRLGEAAAFIAEARSSEASASSGDVLLVAALIHDRAGDAEKANVALTEAGRIVATPTSPESYVADPADAHALRALSLEATSPARAQQAWIQYLEATKSEAFASSARARLAALKNGGARKAGGPTAKRPPRRGASP